MARVILITFAFLGWAWYEMSGGADFVPGSNGVDVIARYVPAEPENTGKRPERVARAEPVVTRDGGMGASLANVTAVVAGIQPQPAVEPEKVAALITSDIRVDAAEPAPDTQDEPKIALAVDYRTVSGSKVNLRNGPGTGFDVVTQLQRGDEVEVLMEDGEGWVKLRTLSGSDIGWMAGSFLTAAN